MSEHTITPKTGPDAGTPRKVDYESHLSDLGDAVKGMINSHLGIDADKSGGPKIAPTSTSGGDTPKPGTANDIADAMSGAIKSVPGNNADY